MCRLLTGFLGLPKRGAKTKKPPDAINHLSMVKLAGLNSNSALLIATKANPQITLRVITRL